MAREAFALRFPYLRNPYGGLFIHQAATVAGAQFNAALVQYLESYGVHFIFGSASQPRRMNDLWQIRTDEGVFQSPVLIDASGVSQSTSPWWEHLPLHPVKGQTVSYKFSKRLPLDASISGMGYLAFLSTTPYELTVGSTYEHQFDHPEPDQEGMKAIGMKLEKMLPRSEEHTSELQSRGHLVRLLSFPTRRSSDLKRTDSQLQIFKTSSPGCVYFGNGVFGISLYNSIRADCGEYL